MSAYICGSAVVRLQGRPEHARPVVLPSTFVADIAAVAKQWATREERHPLRKMDEVFAAREVAADRFSRANDWNVSAKSFPLFQLGTPSERAMLKLAEERGAPGILDHHEYIRLRSQPVGIVTHLYAPLKLELLSDSVVVDALPESWYMPGTTYAYLLRPRGGAL